MAGGWQTPRRPPAPRKPKGHAQSVPIYPSWKTTTVRRVEGAFFYIRLWASLSTVAALILLLTFSASLR